jgi:hypothetical protein
MSEETKTRAEMEADAEGGVDLLEGMDIPALFSAEMPDEDVRFTVGGMECSVKLKPMTADALARWSDLNSKCTISGRGEDALYKIEPDTANSDLKLLAGTVTDMLIYTKQQVKDSDKLKSVQYPYPSGDRAREDLFRRVHPEFRRRLVNECKRVNGLSPLSKPED